MLHIAELLWPIAVATLTASMLTGAAPTSRRQVYTTDSCSMDAIGRTAAVDTSRMRRLTRALAPGESAEGGEMTAYFQQDQPRVVVIQYFGETGKTIVRYFLASPDQYLVEREELRYARPISINSRPTIVARLPTTLYVCGTTSTAPSAPADVKQVRAELDSALARLALDGKARQHAYRPPEGYVPDSITAIRIAKAVLTPVYGAGQIDHEGPLSASLSAGVWTVKGTLPAGMVGGVAVVQIAKRDGRILRMSHSK